MFKTSGNGWTWDNSRVILHSKYCGLYSRKHTRQAVIMQKHSTSNLNLPLIAVIHAEQIGRLWLNEADAAHTHFADINEIFSPFQWFFFYNHLKSGRSSGFLSKNSSFRFFHSFSKKYQTEMYVSLLTSYSSLPTNMAAARFLIMINMRWRHVHTIY